MALGISDWLEQMTLEELREIGSTLGSEYQSYRRKADFVENLVTRFDLAALGRTANRIETLRSFKHVWLASWAPNTASASIEGLSNQLWPGLDKAPDELSPSSNELQPTLQLEDVLGDRLYVKLTHWVQSDYWELSSPGVKRLVSRRVRHPIVVVMTPSSGVVEIRFDGYSQGQGTSLEARVPYERVVAEATELLSEKLGAEVAPLSIAEAINDLLRSAPEEVQDVRRVVRPADGGRLVFDSASRPGQVNVTTMLSEVLGIEPEDVDETLRATPSDSILLAWKKPHVMTRVAFYDAGPELLFIWSSGDKSLSTIEYVVSSIAKHLRLRESALVEATESVMRERPGKAIKASDLTYRFGLAPSAAYEVLEDARRRHAVDRVFRVRTDFVLPGFENTWRSSLGDLPSIVVDENGDSLELRDPKNVEVAFIRRSDSE